MSTPVDLAGTVALVTRAGRGIGLEIARTLRAAKADLVVVALDAATGTGATQDLGGEHVVLDVTDSFAVDAAFDGQAAAADALGAQGSHRHEAGHGALVDAAGTALGGDGPLLPDVEGEDLA